MQNDGSDRPQGRLFFSIIIPAHNEAGYIGDTLAHIAALDYPRESFETIVVENGSTDDTYRIAERYADKNITLFRSDQGTSKAKNAGAEAARADADWIIFLDADTLLEKEFLAELCRYLSLSQRHPAIGTVTVRPNPETFSARLWFALYDFGHWCSHTSASIQIAKRNLFPTVRFDEALITSEDGDLIAQAMRYGTFFIMRTRLVSTSTRRFEKLGWWRTLFNWVSVGILPKRLRRKFTYEVVR
ncbi:MAG: glycosyltransferase [Patescibacteria group bacterium]|nr:glycosyltransferase [Patescibacteria group bacterium]